VTDAELLESFKARFGDDLAVVGGELVVDYAIRVEDVLAWHRTVIEVSPLATTCPWCEEPVLPDQEAHESRTGFRMHEACRVEVTRTQEEHVAGLRELCGEAARLLEGDVTNELLRKRLADASTGPGSSYGKEGR